MGFGGFAEFIFLKACGQCFVRWWIPLLQLLYVDRTPAYHLRLIGYLNLVEEGLDAFSEEK